MAARNFQIPVFVEEPAGLARQDEAVRVGVPLTPGLVRQASEVAVLDESGRSVAHQAGALILWPDGSIKWLLLDVRAAVNAHQRSTFFLRPRDGAPAAERADATPLNLREHNGIYRVETHVASFELGAGECELLSAVRVGGVDLLERSGLQLSLFDRRGRRYIPANTRAHVEEVGPVRATIVLEGELKAGRRVLPLRFQARFTCVAGSSTLRLELQLRNLRAACHPGGLWDLADRGSVIFEDCSLGLVPAEVVEAVRWRAEPNGPVRIQGGAEWSLYQDSSGGENWDSANHVDGHGRPTVSFRGYRVLSAASREHGGIVATGLRATPCVTIVTRRGSVAATSGEFWQNFPKALRWDGRALAIGLFPGECRAPFELQGGEQKRHTVLFDFLPPGTETGIPRLQQPLKVFLDPTWVEETGAMGCFVAASHDHNERYLRYVSSIVEGPHSFEGKRELIDEYGWRNFGDLYADHEAIGHARPGPIISHYNNQYDFIDGALVHFLRTGDYRWKQLADDAARHTLDIDIYHTDQDRPEFNHGLFWHTDHYKPAATATHRTYSRRNANGAVYGGGPSNEHNYTTGLLHYYCLSGDPCAAEAVRELAGWTIAMDEGSNNVFGLLDSGPTGCASRTAESTYHKPGRGAANSINALLDAYELSRERRYMDKAEELIRRCIHPSDDIDALQLTDPERRWSYLVFLQVLCKYLKFKLTWGETDFNFHYARAGLLHYARWMAKHEVPYKDVLHRVLIPTETWPAHDVRKCHVLHAAAQYAAPAERDGLHERAAFFFERCLEDVQSFETAYLTRPLVILCVYGSVHAYFQAHPQAAEELSERVYYFGTPQAFKGQRQRLGRAIRSKAAVAAADVRRMLADRFGPLRPLLWPRRS